MHEMVRSKMTMHFLSRGTSFLRRAYQAENPFSNRTYTSNSIQLSSDGFCCGEDIYFCCPVFCTTSIYWAIKQLEAIYLDVMRLGGGYIKYSS